MKPLYSLLIALCILLTACSKETDKETSGGSVIAKLSVKITDAIPVNVTKIRFTDLKNKNYIEKSITSLNIGKKGMELELNYEKIPDLFNGQLSIYYTDALTSNKTIPNIQLVKGKKMTFASDVFKVNSSMDLDDEWRDSVVVNVDF